jgi:hypothetical protein
MSGKAEEIEPWNTLPADILLLRCKIRLLFGRSPRCPPYLCGEFLCSFSLWSDTGQLLP